MLEMLLATTYLREERDAECTGASDAGGGRALAGSKDGSLGKWCESVDQFPRSTRQSQIIGCQPSAVSARATCIPFGALRSLLDRCWDQNVKLGTE